MLVLTLPHLVASALSDPYLSFTAALNGLVGHFMAWLISIEKGKIVSVQADSLTKSLLDTNKCYLLDCGAEVFVWLGRNTSLEERKSTSAAAEELLHDPDRPRAHIIHVIEGFETVMFRSKFDSLPQTSDVAVSEDGRGKHV